MRCEPHEVAGCAVCLGIAERYEPPVPSGLVKVHKDPYGQTDRTPSPDHHAFIHEPHPMYSAPRRTWGTAPKDHPRWYPQRRANKRANVDQRSGPTNEPTIKQANKALADKLGVAL